MNEIKLKITIEGKEALATLSMTSQEIESLAKEIRTVSDSSKSSGNTIVHAFAQARNLIQGFRETVTLLSQSFNESLKSYQEQEAANIQLATALKQNGNYTEKNYKALLDYSAQLQQTTIYDDDLSG